MRWYTTPDDRACALCISIDGDEVALIGGEFVSGGLATRHPPLHPMCLPGDALVLARDGVAGAVARPYEGDLTVVTTARGHRLSCTPNHPVLTPSGWVPAGALKVGGAVMCDVTFGDERNRPVRIDRVAETVSARHAAAPVPVAAGAFHGDGAGSGSATVWAGRVSWREIRDAAGDGRVAHARRGRFPVDVAVDLVVDVETRQAWQGQVYNLETPGGWYTADGIVVHNCRCVLSLVASAP